MKSIQGMSVVITGGGSGIGKGTAKYFADRGARVTICGRRVSPIAAAAQEIGESCQGIDGDMTKATDRSRIIDAALSFGGGIDVLVNSAGNMYRGPIEALEEDKVLDLFNVNVVAGMMLTGLAVPYLAKRSGAVLFVGSVHNRRAFPGASPYAATKAALEGLTKVLAAELGPKNIRVNCVVPGAVPTEINQRAGLFTDEEALARLQGMSGMHALGRIGTTEEIAEAIAYLTTAEWTTGAVLEVDGGMGLGVSVG